MSTALMLRNSLTTTNKYLDSLFCLRASLSKQITANIVASERLCTAKTVSHPRHFTGDNRQILTNNVDKAWNKIQRQPFSLGSVLYKTLEEMQVKRAINSITDKFMEARELLTDARESEGTVYFSEDMEEAQEAVKETLDNYADLLTKLSDEQRQNVVRTIGLRMEELKAQLESMIEELKEEH